MKPFYISKKRNTVRKRNEEDRELKQYERIRKRKNVAEENINLGRLFGFVTVKTMYVNGLKLHEIRSEIFLEFTGYFQMIGSMLIGEMEQKRVLDLGILRFFKLLSML